MISFGLCPDVLGHPPLHPSTFSNFESHQLTSAEAPQTKLHSTLNGPIFILEIPAKVSRVALCPIASNGILSALSLSLHSCPLPALKRRREDPVVKTHRSIEMEVTKKPSVLMTR